MCVAVQKTWLRPPPRAALTCTLAVEQVAVLHRAICSRWPAIFVSRGQAGKSLILQGSVQTTPPLRSLP